MAGCPFNNFGLCKKTECLFYVPYEQGPECIFWLNYLSSLDNSVWITSLIEKFAQQGLLRPSSFSSPAEYEEHLQSLREWVEQIYRQISKYRDRLKDVP